jgi:hypothetical protein
LDFFGAAPGFNTSLAFTPGPQNVSRPLQFREVVLADIFTPTCIRASRISSNTLEEFFTVRKHSMEIHERGLASDIARDADIANLPHDPWLSYDVWLVNSEVGK